MIDCCRYSMGRRSSGKDIHNQTFIVAMYREIHFPAIFGTPMPIKHILSAMAVPVPVHFPHNLSIRPASFFSSAEPSANIGVRPADLASGRLSLPGRLRYPFVRKAVHVPSLRSTMRICTFKAGSAFSRKPTIFSIRRKPSSRLTYPRSIPAR